MDKQIYEALIAEQFKGKEKLIDPNVTALNMGYDDAQKNFENKKSQKKQSSNSKNYNINNKKKNESETRNIKLKRV